MYKAIKRHPTVLQYEEKLINSGIISNEDVRTFKKTYRSAIEKGKSVTSILLQDLMRTNGLIGIHI